MISVLILTKNEQEALPGCLTSLTWSDDVHVLDSGSSDNTIRIAKLHGAIVSENAFESFGRQRNWALDHCPIRHPWVLFLDADERSTSEFSTSLLHAISAADNLLSGFYCCWKLMFQGRWLKRCDSFPKWQCRVVRQGRVRFMDYGHGQKEANVEGRIDYLLEPYLHYPFDKGWHYWIDRHNRYSDLEARERLTATVSWRDLFSKHGSQRNKALKPLVSRLPAWPLLRFAWSYFFRLGLLEGRPGFIYCVNMAYYEFLIRIKMEEIRSRDLLKSRNLENRK